MGALPGPLRPGERFSVSLATGREEPDHAHPRVPVPEVRGGRRADRGDPRRTDEEVPLLRRKGRPDDLLLRLRPEGDGVVRHRLRDQEPRQRERQGEGKRERKREGGAEGEGRRGGFLPGGVRCRSAPRLRRLPQTRLNATVHIYGNNRYTLSSFRDAGRSGGVPRSGVWSEAGIASSGIAVSGRRSRA